MFENIIEQGAVLQLRDDILHHRNAPSMLFIGPSDSGKGSTAMELARTLSCESDAGWKCSCPSCALHRYLRHGDLLILGNRRFSAEIAACQSAFLRNPSNNGAKLVFFRSLRKLMLRFSPVLMEDDQKLIKSASVLLSLDEKLDDLWANSNVFDFAALKKLCNSLVKDALVLENEGLSAMIPIGQIRSASWWCRLAPNGKRKTLIIENAENMRNEAHNSLLKLLEEPPASVNIVLTAQRREAIMPTILSRLRPYRFLKRSEESEIEIIRRVFQDTIDDKSLKAGGSLLSAYLESFIQGSGENLYPLAALFIVSLARIVSRSEKKGGENKFPVILNALADNLAGSLAAAANASGPDKNSKSADIIKTIISQSGNFENDSFSRYMKICLEIVCDFLRTGGDPGYIALNNIFKKYINETVMAVDVLNIGTAIALESLFHNLKTAMIRGLPSKVLYG